MKEQAHSTCNDYCFEHEDACGKAISLTSEGTTSHLEAIESSIGMKIPVQTADNDLIATNMSIECSPGKRFRDDRSKINSQVNFSSKNTQRNKSHGRSRQ